MSIPKPNDAHRVETDAKYHALPPHFYVVVNIASSDTLAALIEALQHLRSRAVDHVHLVDEDMDRVRKVGRSAEIVLRFREAVSDEDLQHDSKLEENAESLLRAGMAALERLPHSRNKKCGSSDGF